MSKNKILKYKYVSDCNKVAVYINIR